MIAILEGKLVESAPLSAVVLVGGVGYDVQIPITTAERLPRTGETVRLYTHAVYREDSASLYGFSSPEDRAFFVLLLEKVTGIGPRIALNILSRMSVEVLKQAIASSDIALLSKCPGIGKKTAERLVVELRDKVFPGGIHDPAIQVPQGERADAGESSPHQDAVAALVTLGYKPADADRAVRSARNRLGPDAATEALIKAALS